MACVDCFKGHRWLNGYRSTLSENLTARGSLLPVADLAALAKRLIDGYAYLLIDDGTGAEVVRAESFGNKVKIARGLAGTSARAFPAGSCVKWEVTEMAIVETVCGLDCQKTAESKGCDCGG